MPAIHLDASRNIENLGLLVGQLAYGSGLGKSSDRGCPVKRKEESHD